MQKEAKQKWVDFVVNGWLSDDEPASEFLSRANTFLRQYSIDTMNVFESVVKTQSYVAFMQMPSLTASLLFGYLEICKLAHVSSGSAVGSRTFLHGFSSFVSSAGRVFRMNNTHMLARSAVPTIVEGLRCLAHLRDPNCEMLGPVMTARALLHADSLHVLSAPAHASTVHSILRGLTRIMRDSSSLEIGDNYFLTIIFWQALPILLSLRHWKMRSQQTSTPLLFLMGNHLRAWHDHIEIQIRKSRLNTTPVTMM